MTIKKQMKQYIGRKATKRIYQAAPWVGAAVALAGVGTALNRNGSLDSTKDRLNNLVSRKNTGEFTGE